MVALSDLRWLQGSFSTLVGQFYRVGLKTNVRNTVGMVFRPCQAAGTQSEAAYRRRMMGAGPSYRERHRGRIQCKECREDMSIGSLEGHMQTHHGREAGGVWYW